MFLLTRQHPDPLLQLKKFLYKYPQAAFPYSELAEEQRRRDRRSLETCDCAIELTHPYYGTRRLLPARRPCSSSRTKPSPHLTLDDLGKQLRRELNDPRVQQEIRDTLRNRQGQLLRAGYCEVARNEAKVVNYLAQRITEMQ